MLHEKADAVLFRGDGILFSGLHEFEIAYCQLVASRGALLGTHDPMHDQRGLQGNMVALLEHGLGDIALKHRCLDNPCAIAHYHKAQPATGTAMIQPAFDGDVFSYVCPHVANVDVAHTALLSVLALSTSLMVALLRDYCRYEAQEKILGYLTRDKHISKG